MRASESQVKVFERLWPEGAELTEGNLHLAIDNGLNVECWARHFLPAPLWAQFLEDVAPLLKQYLKAEAPFLAQYLKAEAPLWTQFLKDEAPFWAQYEKERAPFLAQYLKDRAPFLAQYLKDRAPLLWKVIQKMQARTEGISSVGEGEK